MAPVPLGAPNGTTKASHCGSFEPDGGLAGYCGLLRGIPHFLGYSRKLLRGGSDEYDVASVL
jgi:hypothetical protein